MADNVAITAGSGTTIGTDERTISSTAVQVQRVDEQGSTAFANGQVTVDTTVGGVSVIAARETRKSCLVRNGGSVAMYVGTGTVSTSNGFLVNPGEAITILTTAQIKAITGSSSVTAYYVEEYDS
jgi:hypothetical protein